MTLKQRLCECGCGAEITAKAWHGRIGPRFLSGHNRKGVTPGQAAAALDPPEDVKAMLTGLCNCGCGGRTSIVTMTRTSDGAYAGWPHRFIRGHGGRVLRGDQSPAWKGGRRLIKKDGYVLFHNPGHPNAGSNNYVPEHRFVMSQLLGRALTKFEHVHHKNGDRADNRTQNLQLLLTSQHHTGQRVEDLVTWARDILAEYGHLYPTP